MSRLWQDRVVRSFWVALVALAVAVSTANAGAFKRRSDSKKPTAISAKKAAPKPRRAIKREAPSVKRGQVKAKRTRADDVVIIDDEPAPRKSRKDSKADKVKIVDDPDDDVIIRDDDEVIIRDDEE